MLIQFGTLLAVSIGAWFSLRKTGRGDAKPQRPKREDVNISAS
jgi:hypothetical protein